MTNECGYLCSIRERFGQKAVAPMELALNELRLPVPNNGEYLHSRGGSPFFLNRFGAVIRASNSRDIPILHSNHLIRPIAAIEITDDLRLDIQPAGRTRVSPEDLERANEERVKAFILIRDRDDSNYMYVGTGNEVVNFDPHCASAINKDIREIGEHIAHSDRFIDLSPVDGEDPDAQDLCFGDLRKSFVAAHDPDNDRLDPQKMTTFWCKMKEAVDEGRLTPSWNDPENISAQKKGVQAIAARYEGRLEHISADH